MIDWVNEACRNWGMAQHQILYGSSGWPSRTILARMMEDGLVGASCSFLVREYPEVLTGRNLVVANAIKRLAEEPRALITVLYVIRGPVKWKCEKIGVAVRRFYERMGEIHHELSVLIPPERQSAQNSLKVCATLAPVYSTLPGVMG